MKTIVSAIAVAAMLAASVPLDAQSAARSQSAAEANAQSATVAKSMVDATLAAKTTPQDQASQGDAPRKHKKSGGSGIGHCAVGAAVGVLGALIFGGKKAGTLVAAGVGGCIVGWGLGAALKGNDEKRLNGYLSDDYIERDDVGDTNWKAPESGQDITVHTDGDSYKSIEHTVNMSPDMAFNANNIGVSVRKMRTTGQLFLRSSPDDTSVDNITGAYDPNEIVQVYGDTNDKRWAYLADRAADGSYQLIGYVPEAGLTSSLAVPATAPVAVAAPKPKPKTKAKTMLASRTKRGTKVAAAPPAPPPPPAAAPRKVTFEASTRCKNVRVSAMGKSGTQQMCGGANNVA